jgi:electron transport complex protein RnfG
MGKSEGNPFLTVLLVVAVAAGAAFIVSTSYEFSKDRIAANERARLLESLNSVLDLQLRELDLVTVRLTAVDALLGTDDPVDVFVALQGGEPVATVFASTAPNGYNAAIRLLIGVDNGGVVTGVRTVGHRETPGLGDRIEIGKSDWILQFDGTTVHMPPLHFWAVSREEEGAFDAMSGATVTSRAVVTAVRDTLLYFERHRGELHAAARQMLSDDAAPE